MDILELLKELVSINTVNNPAKGIKPGPEAAKYIRDVLADWGLQPEIIESNGYHSVVGWVGEGKPCISMLAHYDVVPADPERWSYDPFRLTVVGDRAYGRGALDDKSNVAALMLTLRELSKKPPRCRVFYAITGDEETGGHYGAKVVAERLSIEGVLPRYLVNADGHGMIVITRRRKVFSLIVEVSSIKKRVRGRIEKKLFEAMYPTRVHAHAAYFIPGVDTHPLIAASVFVREENVLVKNVSGRFLKSNVVPASVEIEYVVPCSECSEAEYDEGLTKLVKAIMSLTRVTISNERFSEYGVTITPNVYSSEEGVHRVVFDIRAMIMKPRQIEERVSEALREILPEAKLKVIDGGGGYMYTSPESPLVKAFEKALASVGEPLIIGEAAGASDSRYFTQYGIEAVDFGPRGGNIHGDDEYVLISSLRKLPEIYLGVVRELEKLCIE